MLTRMVTDYGNTNLLWLGCHDVMWLHLLHLLLEFAFEFTTRLFFELALLLLLPTGVTLNDLLVNMLRDYGEENGANKRDLK